MMVTELWVPQGPDGELHPDDLHLNDLHPKDLHPNDLHPNDLHCKLLVHCSRRQQTLLRSSRVKNVLVRALRL